MCTIKTKIQCDAHLTEQTSFLAKPEVKSEQRSMITCGLGLMITAVFTLFLGILSLRYDFLDIALIERIKMRPGLPAFDVWKNPTGIDFRINVFFFAVINSNEFLNGTDPILRFEEIGPISYRKIMQQDDIVFHDENSTMSYTTKYRLEFIANQHDPDFLNRRIIIVNPMLLSFAAYLYGRFYAKFALSLIASEESIFIERTIYEVLWNCTTPMLEQAKRLPFLAPRSNAGIMYNTFYPETTRYNVNIGPKYGYENFFKINTFNGLSRIKQYEDDFPEHCPFSLKGATDGTGIPPRLTKNSLIYGYQDNLCRTYPFIFNRTLIYKGYFEVFEFVLDYNIYKRPMQSELDCLGKTGTVHLPDGFLDYSKCAFGMPVALSNPHFWGFHGNWEKKLHGLNPNQENHQSYVIIEPTTGVPLEGVGRIQMNVPMPSFDDFPSDIQKFGNMILPSFWMEWNVRNDDALSIWLVRIAVNFVPVLQYSIIVILFSLSAFCLCKGFFLITNIKSNAFVHLNRVNSGFS